MRLLKEAAALAVVFALFLVLAAIVSLPIGLAVLLWRAALG
jgi:hypothetical protein